MWTFKALLSFKVLKIYLFPNLVLIYAPYPNRSRNILQIQVKLWYRNDAIAPFSSSSQP